MSDPQSWTLIGVFAAAMLGGLTLVVTLLTRVIDARFEAMGARFDGVGLRLQHLDREVRSLIAC